MPLKTATYLKSATMRLSCKPKRRDLSVNMISLPLGDFHHLSHIGLDARGDAFGDLSAFQQGGGLVLQSSQSHQDLFFATTSDLTPPPPPTPPRLLTLKGTEALDALNKPRTLTQTSEHNKCHSCLDALEVVEQEKAPRVQEEVQDLELDIASDSAAEQTTVEEESAFVLNLNLGPSILEEMLQVMDRIQQ
ncbi:cdc42 effector protein 2-like [Diretmus argenteus]